MKIFAISDLHGKLDFKVPSCDLLLVGGDVCPDYAPGTSYGSSMQEQWLNSKFLNWIDEQPVANWLGTFGNHDFVRTKGVAVNFKVDYLVDFRGIKIWFSPWSNTFGGWAWMKDPDELEDIYAAIPNDVDIIVSHQPPYSYGDQVPEKYRMFNEDPDGHVGSRELLNTIARVKPKVVICGHIHSGYGQDVINIDDGSGLDPNEVNVKIYNVSVVNEEYQLVNEPTEIII